MARIDEARVPQRSAAHHHHPRTVVPFLLGGAVVVESVFGWPGMGKLTVDAIFTRDYPLIIACTLVAGVMVIIGNILADMFTPSPIRASNCWKGMMNGFFQRTCPDIATSLMDRPGSALRCSCCSLSFQY